MLEELQLHPGSLLTEQQVQSHFSTFPSWQLSHHPTPVAGKVAGIFSANSIQKYGLQIHERE
jgi:hypothetical protein